MDTAITTNDSNPRGASQGLRFVRALLAVAVDIAALTLLFCGTRVVAQTTTPGQTSPERPVAIPLETIQAGPLLLGPGDLIDVQIFGTPELSGRMRVDQMGAIRLPIGGSVTLAGLAPAQASGLLESRLKEAQIMIDPHVSTFVVEYATQGITILGEVRAPGTYTLLGPHSLYDALSAAGGATSIAGASITVTHLDDMAHPVVVPVDTPNYSRLQRATAVSPGDTIVVAKAGTISVVGDVTRSGTFYLQYGEPINVLGAVALAAGLNRTAKSSKASIIRPTATGAETIPVDLDKVSKNLAPNVFLRVSDILVIPRSGAKVFLETALPGATAAVVSATASALIVR